MNDHTKAIQVQGSVKTLQHMRSVFPCKSALTCGVSIIVSLFLPLFLAASQGYSVPSLFRHLHVIHRLTCPLVTSSCRFVMSSCDL